MLTRGAHKRCSQEMLTRGARKGAHKRCSQEALTRGAHKWCSQEVLTRCSAKAASSSRALAGPCCLVPLVVIAGAHPALAGSRPVEFLVRRCLRQGPECSSFIVYVSIQSSCPASRFLNCCTGGLCNVRCYPCLLQWCSCDFDSSCHVMPTCTHSFDLCRLFTVSVVSHTCSPTAWTSRGVLLSSRKQFLVQGL